MAKALDVHGIPPYTITGPSSGNRWDRWLKSFDLFVMASGITNEPQKKALLLHYAGVDVQDIFYAFSQETQDKGFADTKKALTDHFEPKKNTTFERHIFRQATQQADETISTFVTRLKTIARGCNYGDLHDDMIKDQVIEKCRSASFKRRLLREDDLTLAKVIKFGFSEDCSESQAVVMETSTSNEQVRGIDNSSDVNAVRDRNFTYNRRRRGESRGRGPPRNSSGDRGEKKYTTRTDTTCTRCGSYGHDQSACRRSKGKRCRICNMIGHFSKCCKSKVSKDENSVKYVETETGQESDSDDYAFSVSKNKDCMINVSIAGVNCEMMIDTGCSVNIVNSAVWELLQDRVKLQPTTHKLYAYGSSTALEVLGTFTAPMVANGIQIQAEFRVKEGTDVPLLSYESAKALRVIHVQVCAVGTTSVLDKYTDCFEGLGKLKNYKLKLHIDETVKPIAQPVRRVPFPVRKQIDNEIEKLLELDIIEKVCGPSHWVSPVVAVPKRDTSSEVRLCVDMRMANRAIVRERQPIPTVDEVLQELSGVKVISKLDLRMGYHQVELLESSRDITTFCAHSGLYRYKRLNFGVSSAPEIYQSIIRQALCGLEGVVNLSDDILCFADSMEEHDKRLEKLFQRLRELGLTLNKRKCHFCVNRVTFMGHVLTPGGISPDEVKVKAIVNAPPPRTVAETKSFLGLVGFCSRFIPDMSTLTEPLRYICKSDNEFKWGSEQAKAFDALKSALASAATLSYYRLDAKTQIVVDASPVGVAAVLLQEQQEGSYRPIAFVSRSLSDVERRYSQTEKEALALVFGCERFHVYIYGMENFELITDHRPLQFIFSPKSKPSPRVERWVLRLQSYKYTVRFKPGRLNIADFLSRLLADDKVKATTNLAERQIAYVLRCATPKAVSIEEIAQASKEDEILIQVRQALKTNEWDKCPKEYKTIATEFAVVNEYIVMRGSRIAIPQSLKQQLLMLAHEGHQGITRTKQRLRPKVWWPSLDKDVETYIQKCHACQLVSQPPPPEPIVSTPMPDQPWSHVAIDLCGPFPTGEMLIVLVDYYSRWVEASILRTATSATIIRWLETVFSTHGYPHRITSDNGSQFVSSEFLEFLEHHGIKKHSITPLWPSANGCVERMNSVFLKAFRTAVAEEKNWKAILPDFLLAYRTTPHSTTGKSPAELLFGRQIRTKLPEMRQTKSAVPDVRRRDEQAKEKSKVYADSKRNAKVSKAKEGDKVLLKQGKKNKLSSHFSSEIFKVVKRRGSMVTLQGNNNRILKRNVSHVKPYLQ